MVSLGASLQCRTEILHHTSSWSFSGVRVGSDRIVVRVGGVSGKRCWKSVLVVTGSAVSVKHLA